MKHSPARIDIIITMPARQNPRQGEYHFPKLDHADVLQDRLKANQLCQDISTALDHQGDIVAVCFYADEENLPRVIQIVEEIYGADHGLDIGVLRENELQRRPVPYNPQP